MQRTKAEWFDIFLEWSKKCRILVDGGVITSFTLHLCDGSGYKHYSIKIDAVEYELPYKESPESLQIFNDVEALLNERFEILKQELSKKKELYALAIEEIDERMKQMGLSTD